MSRPNSRVFRRVWTAAYSLPTPCHFKCGEMVTEFGRHSQDGSIHHLDHNPENNELGNLVVAHRGCHQRYHATRKVWASDSPSECLICGAIFCSVPRGTKRSTCSPVCRSIAYSRAGSFKRTNETRQRMSEGAVRRWQKGRS